jgi:hypothetical protein
MSHSLSKILASIIADRFGKSDPKTLTEKQKYLLKRAEQQLVIEEPDEDDIYSPNVFGVINSVHDEAQKRIENRGEDEEKQKELLN